jgi:hypothetical protein
MGPYKEFNPAIFVYWSDCVKSRKWAIMYLLVRDIDFASAFTIYSNSLVFFEFFE